MQREILTDEERSRVKRLESALAYKERLFDQRDIEAEEERKEKHGDKYVDFLAADIKALDWAIKFIKEHSE